jgi:tetratricopeptide (TPR) repeat protein
LIKRYLRLRARERGEEIDGHQRAINYFISHLQEWDGTIDSCAEKLEIFHHWCELGKYKFAWEVMNTCFDKLDLAGYYQELLKIYQRLTSEWDNPVNNEILNLGWAWVRFGILLQHIGKVNQSIDTHQSAQEIFEQINCVEGKAEVLSRLGDAFQSLGEYQLSIDFYNQSLEISQISNNNHITINALLGIGNAYRRSLVCNSTNLIVSIALAIAISNKSKELTFLQK